MAKALPSDNTKRPDVAFLGRDLTSDHLYRAPYMWVMSFDVNIQKHIRSSKLLLEEIEQTALPLLTMMTMADNLASTSPQGCTSVWPWS